MDTPLLQTKLYIPLPRPEYVSRPRLIEQLNTGLRQNQDLSQNPGFGGKLTLISAPAGFGKTTLASDWLQQLDGPTAWLSLDESDNDPVRFLIYFVAALRTIEADIGKGMLSALQSSQPPPTEAILTSLINEIAAIPNRHIIILDDYHLIEAQPIHDALAFLLERLPPQMHLVIATRDDPHLPLARLRARGQLTELRATDLRFTSAEAADNKDYDEMYQGLGWAYVVKGDDFFIAHSGGGPGFAANMRLYPDRDLGMVILANGTYLPREEIFDLVASLDW